MNILFLEKYPNSDYATDLKFKRNLVENQLAAKELFVARYYISVKKWVPAINRLKKIVKDYDKTIFIEEALHRLVEIHYHIGLENEAKEYAADDHYINPEGNNFSTQFMARLLENRNSLLQDLMQAMKQNDIAMLKEDITLYTRISRIVMLYRKVCNAGENTLK